MSHTSINQQIHARLHEMRANGEPLYGRPTRAAAHSLAERAADARRLELEKRAQGVLGPLSLELFPRNVFDEEGNRLRMVDDSPRLTDMEERAAYERHDGDGL